MIMIFFGGLMVGFLIGFILMAILAAGNAARCQELERTNPDLLPFT